MSHTAARISVVIPVYDSTLYLREALRSVAAQRFPDLELLIVDDGSATRTCADIAAEVERESRIETRYIRQAHAGASAARNRGLAEATGEFIAFLDSDDLFLPGKLARQLEILAQLPSNYAHVIGGYECFVQGRPNDTQIVLPAAVDGDVYAALLAHAHSVSWALGAQLFRRAALVAVGGYDCALSYGEDKDLFLRLARSWKGATHRDVIFRRRIHPGSVSMTIEPARLVADIRHLGARLKAADPHLSETALRRMRNEALLDAAALAVRHPANHARFAQLFATALRGGALAGNWPSWRALGAAYLAMIGTRLRGANASAEDGQSAACQGH